MGDENLQAVVEALLFVSDRPLTMHQIQEVLKESKPNLRQEDIATILSELKAGYESSGRSFQIQEVASGYQLKTLPRYAPFIAKLLQDELKERLTIPALETLAIIAYRQPVTRADVESVRGVSIDGIVKTLMDKDLIRIVGKKDIPGKPFLFGTTKEFLMHFGLKDLNDLPNMEEFKQALVSREKQLDQHRAAAGMDAGSSAVAESSVAPTGQAEEMVEEHEST